MGTLQEILAEKIPALREEVAAIRERHGDRVISEVTVSQALGGMRGVRAMVCDTSVVDADRGLLIRGRPLLELQHLLPEELFFLLITGDLPDDSAKQALQQEFDRRSQVPGYVWSLLEAMPGDSHPMCMLNTALLVMERESIFRDWYDEGMAREDYWVPMIGDALNILARLPVIAAAIYRLRYRKGVFVNWTPGLDYGANFANMLGVPDPLGHFAQLMRMYLLFHADHEGGNVSANACHTVGSSLSDAYYSVAAGLNGLAGPLHGLANQECLKWVLGIMDKHGGVPPGPVLHDIAWHTLQSGRVIPGYGHAVLRVVDPRFQGLFDFGRKHIHGDPVFQTVERVFEVIPTVLDEYSEQRQQSGKAPIGSRWPNVDAVSGSLLHHYGMREFPYYTVVFAVARAFGMLSQLVLNRCIGSPITRPKSVSSAWLSSLPDRDPRTR